MKAKKIMLSSQEKENKRTSLPNILQSKVFLENLLFISDSNATVVGLKNEHCF